MSTIERALEKHRDQSTAPAAAAATDDAAQPASPTTDARRAVPPEQGEELHIDLEWLQQGGLVSSGDNHSQIREEFRFLKRRILNNAFGAASKRCHNPNLVLVTSSRPHEGKTFNTINLALSIAMEQDKTVLLIDADVIRPTLCTTLGVKARKGLMNYLIGDLGDISQAIYKTSVPTLKLIPAGTTHHLSNELLNSEKMVALIDELAQRYPDRIVIFDSPPLLGVNEAHALAEHAGQVIVVVEERRTKHKELLSALSLIPEDKIINLVLNKTIEKEGNGYYGYGYYYGSASS